MFQLAGWSFFSQEQVLEQSSEDFPKNNHLLKCAIKIS